MRPAREGISYPLVDSASDRVSEAAGAGWDTVEASVSHALAANVEALILTGADPINGAGNALANTLNGNSGANVLSGGKGNDTLEGGDGDDRFLLDALLGPSNVDHIVDFEAGDRICLDTTVFTGLSVGALDTSRFASGNGVAAALDSDDRVVYDTASGALYYDADGAGGAAADLVAFVAGSGGPPALAAGDLLVVS
jgi:Ca2+-binding RTX toxin-like protein